MKKIITVFMIGLLLVPSFIKVEANEKPYFKNVGVHDPSIIKEGDTYYVFGTHGAAAKSPDLKNWDFFVTGDIYTHSLLGNIRENLKESFKWGGVAESNDIGGMGIWAPDVVYNQDFVKPNGEKGAYLMYYSISMGQDIEGINHARSLIGLAYADDIEGPYTFVENVIYTGFHKNEGKSHYSHTDFLDVFPNETPRDDYFTLDGSYDFNMYPNAIDPTIVTSHDDRLYMVYGSWHAGVWVLELDKKTGLPLRNQSYTYDDSIKNVDPYFGKQISGGYWTSGEGPYIQYHEPTGYYHLYVTYGGLKQNEEYNMRFFRSKNIDGPYEDIDGKNPIFKTHGSNDRLGNRLMGSFEFVKEQTIDKDADIFDYRVPGHNSVLYDDNGNDYIFFHTRFKDTGEAHELRVHQLLFNEDGWPLIVPERYSEETVVEVADDIAGTYLIVRQEQDNAKPSKTSLGITLEKDGSIKGKLKGTWSFEEGILSITLANATYRGYLLKQKTATSGYHEDYTFTLIGSTGRTKGHSILGIKISDLEAESLLKKAADDLEPPRTENIQANMKLPTQTYGGITIKWASSNSKVMSSSGKVNRSEKPEKLTLTAKLVYDEYQTEKSFDVTVVGEDGSSYKDSKTGFIVVGGIVLGVLGILIGLKVVRTKKSND